MNSFFKRLITAIILVVIFYLTFFHLPPFIFSIVLAALLLYIIVMEWTKLFAINSPAFWLVMPFYPIMPFLLLIILNQSPWYRPLILYLFIMIAAHDTGSYIIGNLFGHNKIAPTISPGKTWEGFFGGYACTIITLVTLLSLQQKSLPAASTLLTIALIVCTLGLFGDLFESWLKRRAHVKDSGAILPGHGGFLDRLDGILFAVFFFYIFKHWLICLFL